MLNRIVGLLFLSLLIVACSSKPTQQEYSVITEESIQQVYAEIREYMIEEDLRSLSKLMHRNYMQYDDVTTNELIQHDLVGFIKQAQKLLKASTDNKVEYKIRSIDIGERGVSAIVISEHYHQWKIGGKYRKTYSLQKNKYVLESGKILLIRTDILETKMIQ